MISKHRSFIEQDIIEAHDIVQLNNKNYRVFDVCGEWVFLIDVGV
jgi:hypothetical protein